VSLISADVGTFEVAARTQASRLDQGGADAEAISAVFDELNGSALAENEKSRRAMRIAEMLPDTAPFQNALAEAAAGASPAIRTAVVGVLPASMQRSAYTGDIARVGSRPQAITPGVAKSAPITELNVEEREDWRSVLLFGSAEDVAGNAHLLTNRGFTAIRVVKPQDTEVLEGEAVCGLIVHRSWWGSFDDPDSLLDFIKTRLSRSNLLYIKLDFGGLGATEEALAEVLAACDAEVRARISAGTDSSLDPLDLGRLEDVAGLLGRARSTRVGVEGLADSDRRILVAAVESFAAHRHLSGPFEPERLSVQPILIGRSGAQVLRLRSAAYRAVFIAKLDDLAKLEDELRRTRSSTPPAGPLSADMCLYSLDGQGVLIQQLLADLDRPGEGAPTLRERLAECMAWERGRRNGPEPKLTDLEVGVDRIIANIVQVNRASAGDPDSRCWSTVETLEELQGIGVKWEISSPEVTFDPATLISRVEGILKAHDRTHVIHGDMNTSNIVMPDDRTPNLIDFAHAGAGHPCFDFVRFSSGVTYEFLRPVCSEEILRHFFRRLHIEGASQEELRTEFPDLLQGVAPGVALHALTQCRRAALDLLPLGDDEAIDQYLAMVYLVAAQALTIEEFESAVVRSVLGAVAPRIELI
jgi:hypothetical protein